MRKISDTYLDDDAKFGRLHSMGVATKSDYADWKSGKMFFDEQADPSVEYQMKTPEEICEKLRGMKDDESAWKRYGKNTISTLILRLEGQDTEDTVITDKATIQLLQHMGIFTYKNYWDIVRKAKEGDLDEFEFVNYDSDTTVIDLNGIPTEVVVFRCYEYE